MRILLVEDDEAIAAIIADFLSSQHYVLDIAYDGQEGWDLIEFYTYDLILLDIMLPKIDGMTLCRKIRTQGYQMPVLLLTARCGSGDKVMGLDVGADDYVVKPFDLKELGARIRALLRRGNSALAPILEWGKLRLDPSICEVTYNGKLLPLSPKEYALIELFLRNGNRILSRQAILNHLWSWEATPGEDTVKAHIKGVRQKFKSVGVSSDLIETVYGMGYRLKPLNKDAQGQQIPQILAGGISEELAVWLQQRLGKVSIQVQASGEATLEAIEQKNWSLLIVDSSAINYTLSQALSGAYSRLKQGEQSVIYCVEKNLINYLPRKIVGQIIFQPLEWEELANAIAETLGLSLPPVEKEWKSPISEQAELESTTSQLQLSLTGIWDKFKDKNLARLKAIAGAIDALVAGKLSDLQQQEAAEAAHKLAGSLGMFGFTEGSAIAKQIEDLFTTEVNLDDNSARILTELVAGLQREFAATSAARG
jgi:DNA-binding response OmpR family regulator/HPt (histidine-containing phosphotransfer) domain-containing protein